MRLWGGRFSGEPEKELMKFSASLNFDVRLYPYEVRVLKAWTKVCEEAGVISSEEQNVIIHALDQIKEELDSGRFEFKDTDEDIHTAVERRLKEIAGNEAGKIRIGRSRNDLVATDERLLVIEEMKRLNSLTCLLEKALLFKAKEVLGVVVPGHTHLKQAQPVLLSHLILCFAWMFERDRQKFSFASNSADLMSLGSGAFAGTTLPLDRKEIAHELGFSRISENSVDAVADRDFVIDAVYSCAIAMNHASRLAEQLILWCSDEFGLVEISDEWSTGSSMMPQKKNPDGLELVRGKAGRVSGALLSLLVMMKGLPLSYNRDMQEDKEPLFDAIDTTKSSLTVLEGIVRTLKFDLERAKELVGKGYIYATDLADYLAGKGVDFAHAHEIVGKIISYCNSENKTLSRISIDELKRFSNLFENDALALLDLSASISRRSACGGTAISEVERQMEKLGQILEN